MAPARFVRLTTLCAAILCCAGAIQLGGSTPTFGATSLPGDAGITFKSDHFPLDR